MAPWDRELLIASRQFCHKLWQNCRAHRKQLVEALHVPKVARREALGVQNLLFNVPARRLEEPRAPPTLSMQLGNVFSQLPVEQQNLTVYRICRLDLTAYLHH